MFFQSFHSNPVWLFLKIFFAKLLADVKMNSNKGRMLFFFSDETQVNIIKHVLKTLCADVTNILVNFLAADLMMSVENPSTITSEVRLFLCSTAQDEVAAAHAHCLMCCCRSE